MNERLLILIFTTTVISFLPQSVFGVVPTPTFEKQLPKNQSTITDDRINVVVDWNKIVRKIPKFAYGVNSAANFIPDYSNDPVFMSNLKMITQKKGFVRLHGWGMLGDSPEAWQNNGIWDSVKINQALRPLVDEGYEVIINIPSGPRGENDYQDPARGWLKCHGNAQCHLGYAFIHVGKSISECRGSGKYSVEWHRL